MDYYQYLFNEIVRDFKRGRYTAYATLYHVDDYLQNFIDAGVDVNDISKFYLHTYKRLFDGNHYEADYYIHDFCRTRAYLPEDIRLRILKRWLGDEMSINFLEGHISENHFASLEDFFAETGLDLDFLIEKFLRDDGYTNCLNYWLGIKLYLIAPERIDAERVVQMVVKFADYNDELIKTFYDRLSIAGANDAITAPLLQFIEN